MILDGLIVPTRHNRGCPIPDHEKLHATQSRLKRRGADSFTLLDLVGPCKFLTRLPVRGRAVSFAVIHQTQPGLHFGGAFSCRDATRRNLC